MAGGYESEDRQAELEELRREQEREAWEQQMRLKRELEKAARSGHALTTSDGSPAHQPGTARH